MPRTNNAGATGAPLLMPPMAKATPIDNVPTENWYSIKARAGEGVAEIGIYDDIGAFGVTAKMFAQELMALRDVSLIRLYVHSYGGDVMEGTAIYNLLADHPARVEVTIMGVAASMASVIAMVGDVVIIPENAWIMVHRPWGIQGGDADDMRRYAGMLDQVEDTLVMAYVKKTGKSEDEIKTLLAEETWLNGQRAVELGFADQLAEPLQVAASLKSHRVQEFEHMPKQVQNLMNPRGQGGQSTPPSNGGQGGGAPQGGEGGGPSTPPNNGGQGGGASLADFQAQEQQRRNAIKAVFKPFGGAHAELERECLDDMAISAEAAKDKLLAGLGGDTTPTGGPRRDTGIHAGNGNIVGDGIRNCIEARVGLGQVERDNAYAGMTLMECARASLSERGVGIASYSGDRMAIVGAAFTHSSSDFGNLLADVARKAMLKGHDESEETFQKWTSKGTLPDFRPMKRVDLTAFPSLRQVREGAEYKYASVGDRAEQIMLATYGELFAITRQTIINDDLSAFNRIPRMMGRAAIRTVGDLVYAVLINNPKMADGKALFHSDHGNLMGAGGLSVSRYDEAKTKMRRQKEGDATLNIRPAYNIVPVSLESTAKALLAAEYDPAMAEAKVPNPVRGLAEVVADARLDEASVSTSYLAADPNMHDTIEVAYLDGNDAPYLEQQDGFTVDGAKFKVRIDAGVAPLSFRTMVKLPGN
ncbi:ATP-dependent Clp protease proteolytic subunit [Halomonas sp. H33-56]|uniref:ClpP-like prohead protease/major capsid protein fusion protein n=1 Tax=Halomonas sp. H33-56 TaxID=2950873 RepID=UPI0032DFE120